MKFTNLVRRTIRLAAGRAGENWWCSEQESVINLRAGKDIKQSVVSVVKIPRYRYDKIIINSSNMRNERATGPQLIIPSHLESVELLLRGAQNGVQLVQAAADASGRLVRVIQVLEDKSIVRRIVSVDTRGRTSTLMNPAINSASSAILFPMIWLATRGRATRFCRVMSIANAISHRRCISRS